MHSLGRAALAAAMMIVGAGTAKAQITTFVASPPRKNEPAQQAAAQQREKVAQDSVARVAMTGMKEWVDSASAALAIRPDTTPTAADTALGTPRAATAPAPKSERRELPKKRRQGHEPSALQAARTINQVGHTADTRYGANAGAT